MPIKPEQLIRALMREGCRKKGKKGSHQKMYNPATKQMSIVPMHKGQDIGDVMWRDIRRQLGLPDKPVK